MSDSNSFRSSNQTEEPVNGCCINKNLSGLAESFFILPGSSEILKGHPRRNLIPLLKLKQAEGPFNLSRTLQSYMLSVFLRFRFPDAIPADCSGRLPVHRCWDTEKTYLKKIHVQYILLEYNVQLYLYSSTIYDSQTRSHGFKSKDPQLITSLCDTLTTLGY
jgi:hypothetical protein